MRKSWLALLSLIASVSVSACAGTTQSSPVSTMDNSALVKQIMTHCTDLAAPELGEGSLCIDNGFRLKTDDFSFANTGLSTSADGNVTTQTLVDLFGHDAVCIPSEKESCILRPTAIQKLEEWNTGLNGGRCEGLATLSTRFALGMDSPSAYQANATSTAALLNNNPKLNSEIVYWWATQFLNEVRDRTDASRTMSPLEIVDDLIQGLAHSVGYTVGIYNGSSGHSVTPFAVTHRGDEFIIHIYDNNRPGERFEISVDSTTNTWRYPNAFLGVDGTYQEWSGGTGTLELTAMSSRKGPFQCSFCRAPLTDATNVITIASRDVSAAGYVHITTDTGELRVTPTEIVNSITDATYAVGKGKSGGLITVTLPQSIQDFEVRMLRASSEIPAADVVVGLRRPDGASLQVTGNLAHDVLLTNNSSQPLLTVRNDATMVQSPQQNNARISLSAGSRISRRTLNAGETMTVRSIAGNSIEVAIKGANGGRTPFTKIALAPTSPTTEINITIGDNGQISLYPSRVDAVRVTVPTPQNFTPGKARQTTTSTIPSIEISEPD